MKTDKCIMCNSELTTDERNKQVNTCVSCRELKQFIITENIARMLTEMSQTNKQQDTVFDQILAELKEIKLLLKKEEVKKTLLVD